MFSKLCSVLIFVSLVNAKHFAQDFSGLGNEYNRLNNTRALNNKVAIVTGSTLAVGKSILILFSQLGAQVVVVGKNAAQVKQVAQQAQQASPQNLQALQFVGDLTKNADINRLITQTINKFSRIDILVNNPSVFIPSEIGDVNFMTSFDTTFANLRAATQLNQVALQHLRQSQGNLLHISSIAASAPVQQFITFGMAKAALEMMSKSLAVQLGSAGIRVNTVSPSISFNQITGNPSRRPKDLTDAEFAEAMTQATPLGRLGSLTDIANACAFLVSADASFITGATLTVDGGALFNVGSLNTINTKFQYVYENEDDTADDSVDNTDNDADDNAA